MAHLICWLPFNDWHSTDCYAGIPAEQSIRNERALQRRRRRWQPKERQQRKFTSSVMNCPVPKQDILFLSATWLLAWIRDWVLSSSRFGLFQRFKLKKRLVLVFFIAGCAHLGESRFGNNSAGLINNPASGMTPGDNFERQFLRVLNKVYQHIERSEARLADQDRKDVIKLEWQQVALIIDRWLELLDQVPN